MTQPLLQDRPLVTFALFAYNQEEYIHEAVEGAFSQTYEPLEIILSDDCSSDSTFEIMEEMAAAYEGPHRVQVRQNELNLGTAQHCQSVANIMLGELMIVAAGDDISLPERTEELVAAWVRNKKKASIIHSEIIHFNHGERAVEKHMPLRNEARKALDVDWFLKNRNIAYFPPTAAYSRKIFDDFPALIGGSIIEDGPLSFRGILKSGFLAVSKPLVIKRIVPESAGSGYFISDVNRWNRFIRSRIIAVLNSIQDLSTVDLDVKRKVALNKYFLSNIRRLARCVFSEVDAKSPPKRFGVFLKILFIYPIRYSVRGRIGFALEFSQLLSPSSIAYLQKVFGRRK